MEHLSPQHIHSVFRVHPQDDGSVHHQLAGKYVEHNGVIDVLEDHFDMGLQDGPIDEEKQKLLNSIRNSSYMKDVSHQDWLEGKHPELYENLENVHDMGSEAQPEDRINSGGASQIPAGRTARFHVKLKDSPETFKLFVRGDAVVLNDQPLEEDQIKVLRQAIDSGDAKITYAPEDTKLQRMEEVFNDLIKLEPQLQDALGSMRQAVKAGHLKPEHLKALTGSIFKDTMVPSLGNKKAFGDFLNTHKQPGGIHVMGDANQFKAINDTYGHAAGDQAIKAMGGAWREALDESVGRAKAKAHRIGGDEFHAYVPTHEHAVRFARALRGKLEALPAIGGAHQMSMSLGIGHSPEHADSALYQAKEAKNAMGYKPGQAKMHVHSLVPGSEGPVPTGEHGEVSPLKPPPIGIRP